jgi:hypothetical protein
MMLSGKLLFSFGFVALLLACVSEKETLPATGSSELPIVEGSVLPDAGAAQGSDFVVTKDIYAQTFSEVEALISILNEIIKEKNFEEWKKFLTTEYISTTGSPEFLREASQGAVLLKNRIVLKSLKDYFIYVVVPSRSQAMLSDISFLDATHVKAITVIDGTSVILYLLVKVDAHWMVGIW